jgi:hypothetical protein
MKTRPTAGANAIGFQHLGRLHHGVSGSELPLLHGISCAVSDRLLHGFTLMADHHHRRPGRNVCGEIEYVVDDRPSRGAMEDFDRSRFHPRAEAGGEDDDFQIVGHGSSGAAHACVVLRIRSSVLP